MKHRILVLIVLVSMVFFTTIPASADGINVIVNGTFDTDTDWTKGDGWTIEAGRAVGAATYMGVLTADIPPLTIGKSYKITYTITLISGDFCIWFGASNITTPVTESGTYEEIVVADATGFNLSANLSPFTGTIDDISAVEISDETPTATPLYNVQNHFTYGNTINIILVSALCAILILGFGTLGILGMTASRK